MSRSGSATSLLIRAALIVCLGLGVGAAHAALVPIPEPAPNPRAATDGDLPEGFVAFETAAAWLDTGEALFLDAGRDDQYREVRIPTAMHLPATAFMGGELPQLVFDLPRGVPLVVYCRGRCDTAVLVARRLREAGFDQTHVLEAGLEKWETAGHPVER